MEKDWNILLTAPLYCCRCIVAPAAPLLLHLHYPLHYLNEDEGRGHIGKLSQELLRFNKFVMKILFEKTCFGTHFMCYGKLIEKHILKYLFQKYYLCLKNLW